MTSQNGRAFNEWLRAQLKAKKMSQRQLAQQSGVDHSTISRLIRGDRMPSLGTATKLARGLRELRDDADTPQYLGLVAAGATNPTARVEYALRADDMLTEPQVRQIMEYYLAVRMRRFGRAFQPGESSGERAAEHSMGQTSGRSATGMTPRLGTARSMTGTVRPMAPRPLTEARTLGPMPRPIGAPRPMQPQPMPSRPMQPRPMPPRSIGGPRPIGRASGPVSGTD
jgi:transcriptional regulator with XRE-family HTH domain